MNTYNDLSAETLATMIVTINKVIITTTMPTDALIEESLKIYRMMHERVGYQTAQQLLTVAWAAQQ